MKIIQPDLLPPTERQAAIFAHLYDSTRRDGYQPSVRELMRAFGIRSPEGVHCHLRALAKKGYVAGCVSRKRSLRFIRRPDGSPFRGWSEPDAPRPREDN